MLILEEGAAWVLVPPPDALSSAVAACRALCSEIFNGLQASPQHGPGAQLFIWSIAVTAAGPATAQGTTKPSHGLGRGWGAVSGLVPHVLRLWPEPGLWQKALASKGPWMLVSGCGTERGPLALTPHVGAGSPLGGGPGQGGGGPLRAPPSIPHPPLPPPRDPALLSWAVLGVEPPCC